MPKRILIADDELMIREGLESMIQSFALPLQVLPTAKNGQEVMALAKKYAPEIIVTDICMPKLSGLDCLRALQEGREKPAYIIIVSGFHEFEYAREAISLGVNAYLLKPLQEKELREALEKALQDLGEESLTETQKAGLVEDCLRILREGFADANMELGKVAKDLAVHPDYLSRKLKQKTGSSFVEWLTKLRMQKAIELISQGQYALYQVAEMVGYANPHYFSTAFKNYTGVSPKHYKEKTL